MKDLTNLITLASSILFKHNTWIIITSGVSGTSVIQPVHEAREVQGLLTTDRVPQWSRVKIFQRKKNGRRYLNGRNSNTKRDIVMSPIGKMVITYRATNSSLTKIVLLKQKIRFLAKMCG